MRPWPDAYITLNIPVSALAAIWPVDITWTVTGQPWLLPLCRDTLTSATTCTRVRLS